MRILLAEHYGQKAKRLRRAAQGYVDDKLREVFPAVRTRAPIPASEIFPRARGGARRPDGALVGMEEEEVEAIFRKLETRASSLKLYYPRSQGPKRPWTPWHPGLSGNRVLHDGQVHGVNGTPGADTAPAAHSRGARCAVLGFRP